MTVSNPTFGFKGLMDQMHGPRTLVHDLSAAVVAGQFAGLVMALMLTVVFGLFMDRGPLFPVQVIGSIFYGDEALLGMHMPSVFAGVLLHQLGPALLWSLVFGLYIYTLKIEGMGRQLLLGLAIGVMSQMVDVYVLVPAAFHALQGIDLWAREVPAMWSWAAHIVFGLSLGVYPIIDKMLSRT